MKIEYRWIGLICSAFVLFLLIEKPLEWWLLDRGIEPVRADLLDGIIVRLIMTGLLMWALFRYGFGPVNGLYPRLQIVNTQALVVPFLIVGLLCLGNLETYRSADGEVVVLFALFVLLVGLVEELTFRGMILPLLIRRGWGLTGAVLLSSLLFGVIHYFNLLRQPDNFAGVNGQVIIAFCLGGFFAGLFLRTGNIFPAALFHAFFNFTFAAGALQGKDVLEKDPTEAAGLDAGDIGGLVVFGLVLISGLVMARWADEDSVRDKVKDINLREGTRG